MTKRSALLELPRMSEVSVRQFIYHDDSQGALEMDVYHPPAAPTDASSLAVVVLVTGHHDPTIEAAVGCKLKDTEQYRSWARLLAVSGMVAITYANRNPSVDIHSLMAYLNAHAEVLRIDVNRIGIWSCSANVPNAIGLLTSKQVSIRCSAFLYGFMLDLGGSTTVADAAAQSGFAMPNDPNTIDEIPEDIPLRIVRAGADQIAGLNQTIDSFCAAALARNLPVTLANHPNGPHSFDILDDSMLTKQLIRDTLDFFAFQLGQG